MMDVEQTAPSFSSPSMTNADSEYNGKKDDSHLIQIKASKAEIDRRINAFIEKKQQEVDINNVQEFCSRFSSIQDGEESCARTEAVFVPRAGGKSHMKVTRVVNPYGPQTRALGSGIATSPSKVNEEPGLPGVEERLANMEAHLKMKAMSKTDMFSRLQVLEERILFLESMSPEYFTAGPPASKRHRSDMGPKSTYSNPDKGLSVGEIDEKIKRLREELLKKSLAG